MKLRFTRQMLMWFFLKIYATHISNKRNLFSKRGLEETWRDRFLFMIVSSLMGGGNLQPDDFNPYTPNNGVKVCHQNLIVSYTVFFFDH